MVSTLFAKQDTSTNTMFSNGIKYVESLSVVNISKKNEILHASRRGLKVSKCSLKF